MHRKTSLILVATLSLSFSAQAGKPERDKQKEVEPKVKEAEKAVNDACKGGLKFDVKWDSYAKADDMWRVPEASEAIAELAKSYCTSPEDQKAFADLLKTVVIKFNSDMGDPAYDKGKKAITVGSTSSSYNTAEQVQTAIDNSARAAGGWGKAERAKKTEAEGNVKTAEKSAGAACKAKALKIEVDWKSYKTADDMSSVHDAAAAIADAAKNYCGSPDDQKAFNANVSKFTVAFAEEIGDPAYDKAKKTISIHSKSNSFNGDHQIKTILDAF